MSNTPSHASEHCAAITYMRPTLETQLAEFENYMKRELELSPVTISGRIFMIRHYLEACANNPDADIFSVLSAETFLNFLSSEKKYSRKSLQYVTHCLRMFFESPRL